METILYWFSGSGNSLAAAKRVAQGLESACLAPIPNAPEGGKAAERVGVFFPVYSWGLPEMVERFLRVMPAAPGAYVFALATYGAMAGPVMNAVERILRRRNIELAAGYKVKSVENYPPMGGAPGAEKRRKVLAAADEKLDRIAAEIADSKRGHVERAIAPVDWIGRAASAIGRRHFSKADSKFFSGDNCTSCGTCCRVCPAADIEIADGRPRWLGHCQQCFACLYWCPENAIHYARIRPRLVQYTHPGVKLQEMLLRERPPGGSDDG